MVYTSRARDAQSEKSEKDKAIRVVEGKIEELKTVLRRNDTEKVILEQQLKKMKSDQERIRIEIESLQKNYAKSSNEIRFAEEEYRLFMKKVNLVKDELSSKEKEMKRLRYL